jgi:hypothetical protein
MVQDIFGHAGPECLDINWFGGRDGGIGEFAGAEGDRGCD